MATVTVDITPHPRILSVLGEIEFEPWQCVAELIDNSVDGFLQALRSGAPNPEPIVLVAFGRDTVVVKDNGPGMSIDTLQDAVRAGWTSQERFGSLGLYGVGFNIATARLGRVTTVWTTQRGEPLWYGFDIDLLALARGQKYSVDVRTRTKSNPNDSGTEVEVAGLRPDWIANLSNPSWVRTNVTARLSRIYGTMLREQTPQPIHFALRVNDRRVSAWEHCVWPADWTVYRKEDGLIRPIQEIDVTFGTKYLSRTTGDIYDSLEGLNADDLVPVAERVYGWLGIQRYADEQDFGVDILRNGRKIEWACKDIFDWILPDGTTVREYPIDDPRVKGRIVGEIHLDHGYVNYTKHHFEREHSSWKQLLRAVRNNEPLTNRPNAGLSGVNTSKLGTLFRAFRRNSPQRGYTYQDILYIKENDTAKAWADKWRRGVTESRDDEKWRRALEASDAPPPLTTPTPSDDPLTPDEPAPEEGASQLSGGADASLRPAGTGTEEASLNPDDSGMPTHQRTPLSELSLHVTGIGVSGKAYDVEVYTCDAQPLPGSSAPWHGAWSARGVYEIEVDLNHAAFKSTSLTVRDAVLAELAHVIASEEAATAPTRQPTPYSDILVSLRARYSTMDSLDVNRLRMDVENIRKRLCAHLNMVVPPADRVALLSVLPTADVERLELAQARGPASASAVDYLEVRHLAALLEQRPELFFDGRCVKRQWSPENLLANPSLLAAHQARLLRDLAMPLSELGDFSGAIPLPEDSRSYLALVRACVNRALAYLVDGAANG